MFKKITLTVTFIHLAGIFFLLFSPVKKSKIPPQQFIVQTHTFKQKTATPRAASPIKTKAPVPQKKTTPPKKKAAPPTPAKPKIEKTPAKKTPVVEKKETTPPNLQKKIVQELEEIVSKIEETQEKITPPSSLQETAVSLQNTATVFAINPEESYQNNLLTYLYEALHLPEQGEVKMQLTIKEDGTLAKIVVLKAESVKNRNYLEKQLPLLRFPYLQDVRVKEKTFVLTFCNEPKT